MVVLRLEVLAEERTGLFCRLLGPESASRGSLGVETLVERDSPGPRRSMPRPLLEKTELRETSLPGPVSISTPSVPLKAMVLDPAAVPSPILLLLEAVATRLST